MTDHALTPETLAELEQDRDEWRDSAEASDAQAERAIVLAERYLLKSIELRAERDAALAEVAALRERITAVVDEWAGHGWLDPSEDGMPTQNLLLDLRAALDAAPADRDDDGGRDA